MKHLFTIVAILLYSYSLSAQLKWDKSAEDYFTAQFTTVAQKFNYNDLQTYEFVKCGVQYYRMEFPDLSKITKETVLDRSKDMHTLCTINIKLLDGSNWNPYLESKIKEQLLATKEFQAIAPDLRISLANCLVETMKRKSPDKPNMHKTKEDLNALATECVRSLVKN